LPSNDYKKTKYISLDLSHQDESNGNNFISLISIFNKLL